MSSLISRRSLIERELEIERELLRRAAREKHRQRGGLFEFVKYFWHILEPKTPFVDGWAIRAICEHLEAVTYGDITRILINVPPGFMKALDCDTQVLTTKGWKRHGDLAVDDYVYGPDGLPKRVEGRTENAYEESYKVDFDDGSTVFAGAGHLWAVERDVPNQNEARRGSWKRVPQIVTTPELLAGDVNAGRRCADRIPVTQAISGCSIDIPADPYVLGAWLGDGDSRQGILFCGRGDLDHFMRYGSRVVGTGTAERIQVPGLTTALRSLGMLNNKRIPDKLLRSSTDQRWALLQGLMDTDGQISPEGWCRFTSGRRELVEDFIQLACSLGLKPRIGASFEDKTAKIGSKRGPYWRVRFTPPPGSPVFRLPRKLVRLKQNGNVRGIGHRFVDAVKPAGQRLVNCIQVEGGLYLVTNRFVTTHNSLLTNTFWPAWEWGPMNMPHIRTLSFSYAVHLTERDNGKFKDLIKSLEYQALYGDRFSLVGDGVQKPSNNKTGWKLASSLGGVSTGERGDRLCADDLHNVADGESDVVRQKTVRLFDEALSNRLNDLKKSAIIVIMQRVNEGDVAGHIIEHEPGYEHLMIPMEWDGRRYTTSIGWTDPREYDGELAWPERYPEETLQRFRRNAFLWAGQYQQAPEPRGGGMFKRDWWGLEHVPFGKAPPMCEYVVASLDSAYTKQERNDPSGFTVWGVYRDAHGNPKVLMLGAWRKHLEMHGPHHDRLPGESERAYVDRCKKDWGLVEWVAYDCKRLRVDRLLIEAKASGITVAQEMRRLYANESWGIDLVNPEGDKYARAVAVMHLWADGMVMVPASLEDPKDPSSGLVPRDWAQLVIDEMAVFPNGRFRDLTDSTTQALKHLRGVGLAVRREERMDEQIARSMHKEQMPPLYPV